MKILYIINCSKVKSKESGLMLAKQRYQGNLFRAKYAYLKSLNIEDSNILILSMGLEKGFCFADDLIPHYDLGKTPPQGVRKFTRKLAEKLFNFNFSAWDKIISLASSAYESAIPANVDFISYKEFNPDIAGQSIGIQMSRYIKLLSVNRIKDLTFRKELNLIKGLDDQTLEEIKVVKSNKGDIK